MSIISFMSTRLVEAETFDHDCAIDLYTECGSPVVNEAGDLVGMCTSSSNGYLTALNVISIAKKMEALAKRDYKVMLMLLK